MRTTTARTAIGACAALTVLSLTACTSSSTTTTGTQQVPTERTSTMAPAPSSTPEPTTPAPGTAVVLTIGDTPVRGELWDNPAARDLAARLPLTLDFSDYNAVEKIARLDQALTMDGMPAGDDPNPGEIGWYAPSGDLVLYYGDVGFWNGIARLGTIDDAGIELLAEAPQDITVTIAPADG
jgi:hypothetical protein